jgi:predicted phosphodiesterase/biotin operon repressor
MAVSLPNNYSILRGAFSFAEVCMIDEVKKLKLEHRDWGRGRISKALGISEKRVRRMLTQLDNDARVESKVSTLDLLGKERTLDELCNLTGKHYSDILTEIDKLKLQGYDIANLAGKFWLSTIKRTEDNKHELLWDGTELIRFGVVSDTHMGSTYEQNTFLHQLYDFYASEGIATVFHAGDISEGYYTNRQEQIYQLHAYGEDQQAEYIIKHYPKREGMTTHFITGNHDFTHMRNGGANIGKHIALERKDMIYLGADRAVINLTPNFKIELRHPGNGTSYADSYQLQKLIEAISGGDKPNAIFVGHYHKYNTTFYRNVFGFLCPAVQWQSPFMLSKNLRADVGGLMVEAWVDKTGTIKRLRHEMIPLFVGKKNDYGY